MSLRYGISLIPDPSFTARVYRARQLICGQFGAWAAEMHMLHLSLADYFQCSDESLPPISAGLAAIAGHSRREALRFPMMNRGISTFPDAIGHIHLDFTVADNPLDRRQRQLDSVRQQITALLQRTPGVVPNPNQLSPDYRPHIPLMQYAPLPPSVFNSAVEFATAVARDLEIPNSTRAGQLVLVRFESDAAVGDWNDGSWAADLRWQWLDAYPL